MIGVMILLSLFIYSPLIGFSQAPPNEIGSPPTKSPPPGKSVGDTAPPSSIGGGRVAPAPPLVVGDDCLAYGFGSVVDGNATSVNASTPDNRSNDFGRNTYDSQFTLTSSLIAKDLSSLSPADIKEYDLKDLSTDEIRSVLCHLTPGNLTKVLMNIPAEDLNDIRKTLTPLFFQNIIKVLPGDNRIQIENRIINHTR